MDLRRIDLEAEVARVRGELIAFRDECLPALVRRESVPFVKCPHGGPTSLGRLEWGQATLRLIEALPVGGRAGRLDPAWFAFLHGKSVPGFAIREGTIEWRCDVGLYGLRESTADFVLGHLGGCEDSPEGAVDQILARLPEVYDWLLGRPVDETLLYNMLGMALPILVDVDLEFVLRALDSETWLGVVMGTPGLTPVERLRRRATIDGVFFQHVLNNALLHVMGAMANNRFGEIPGLMGHPNLRGSYTDLMPHYLLGVLLAKAMALREMAGAEGPADRSNRPHCGSIPQTTGGREGLDRKRPGWSGGRA